MTREWVSGRELNVIWKEDMIAWQKCVDILEKTGIDKTKIILVKEHATHRAGIGIEDDEIYTRARLTLP